MISGTQNHADVVVIGGGPAGATCSTLIAQQGHRVQLFEREKFPRFHIGESLIPETYWVLERLNMLDKMRGSHFVKKVQRAVRRPAGKLSEPFYFMDHKPHECSQTWQVLRSEFDKMMLDNAREHGVEVHEGVRVLEVLFDGERGRRRADRRTRTATQREIRAKVVVDASGQSTLIANRFKLRVGSGAEERRPVDLLRRGLSRHGTRRRGHARLADRGQEGLVLVHSAAQQHHQRRRGGGVRLSVRTAAADHEKIYHEELDRCPAAKAARVDRQASAPASMPPRTIRIARGRRPATAGCWSATPSAFSIRSIRRACCWL